MKLIKLLLISITALSFTACETSHKYATVSGNAGWIGGGEFKGPNNGLLANPSFSETPDRRTYSYESSNDMNAFKGNTYVQPENEKYQTTIKDDINKAKNNADTSTVKRKIAYTANVSLTVESKDSIANYVTKIAETYGGYMTYSNSYTVTIKVKADSMKAAIAKIEALGEVRYSNISSQDVTDQYTDLNIRLENAMKARERYLELLEKAANVEEALLVEKELERLNLTIDQIKGTLNQLGDRIVYSTITVTYYKKKDDGPKPGILGYVFVGIYKGVKWLFVRG